MAVDPATDDPELTRLQQLYGDQWHIWCTALWWVATARDRHTTSEPTLIEDTAEQLEQRIKAPGPRAGGWDI